MKNDIKEFITSVKEFFECDFKEKGSQFIGQIYNVTSVEDAQSILSELKKKYYDATHICYAFHLADNTFKYSDDGEPSGTAGIRIYNAIQHFDISDVLVVSIRYFGGTKLGVGPLGKAYYKSAFDVIDNAKKIKLYYFHKIKIVHDYSHTKTVHHFLGNYLAKNITPGFDDKPFIECYLVPKNLQLLQNELDNSTNGQVKLNIVKENILA